MTTETTLSLEGWKATKANQEKARAYWLRYAQFCFHMGYEESMWNSLITYYTFYDFEQELI